MKRKSTPSTKMPADFQYNLEQDKKHLLSRYKSKEVILSELREIPVSPRTYELLGELFFNAAARELENDLPTDEWIRELRNIRADVYQLFEMARASRVLK